MRAEMKNEVKEQTKAIAEIKKGVQLALWHVRWKRGGRRDLTLHGGVNGKESARPRITTDYERFGSICVG